MVIEKDNSITSGGHGDICSLSNGLAIVVIDIDDISSGRGRGVVSRVEKQGKTYTIGLGDLKIEPDSENSKWLQMLHYWNSKY